MLPKKKAVLSILLTVCMLLTAFGTVTSALAAEDAGYSKDILFVTRTLNNRENEPGNQMVRDEIEKRSGFNLNVIFIPGDSYIDRVNLMLASEEKFDVMDMASFGTKWAELQSRGALAPLKDAIAQHGPVLQDLMANGFRATTDGSGEIWGIPRAPRMTSGNVPDIRKDWLEKFGMEAPTTLAELEAYFEAVLTRDPNGNGQNDEIPLIGRWGIGGLISSFAPYFTGFHGDRYLDEEGVIHPIIEHPGYKDMLSTFRSWYEKGYLYKENFVVQDNQINDLIIANRVGATAAWYSNWIRPVMELQKTVPEAEHIPLPLLTDSKLGKAAYGSNPPYDTIVTLSNTSENVAGAIAYINWIFSDIDNYMLVMRGIEGVHWNWVDKEKKIIEVIDNPEVKYGGGGIYGFDIDYSADEFIITAQTTDPVSLKYNELMDILLSPDYAYVYAFDYFVPYNLVGTPLESISGDGATLITEMRLNYVTGDISSEDFDKMLAEYMQIEGDLIVSVYTEQYNAFVK